MRRAGATLVLAAAALWGGAGWSQANEDVALHVAAGDVVMPNITYAGWNYAPFDQIDVANVAELTVVWTLQLGVLDQWEASPLVVGNTMYVASPVNQSIGTGQAPNVVMAIDLRTQIVLWEFRPDVDRETGLQACCGAQTRGLNYAEGRIFYTTIDGQSFALDAETGEAVWRTVTVDVAIREHSASNAIVIGDLYIVGDQGGEYGVRGRVSALDINTGEVRWVMYSMGPDNEVGIGPRFEPFYADDRAGSLGTWFGDSWRLGGGAAWGYFTYDPDLNLLYYSTGNCGPWNPDYRREWGVVNLDENGGLIDYRNNWCASQLARDATTGELIWAYNIAPGDNWDMDQPIATALIDIDTDGDGALEAAAAKPARNGYYYVWDRATGELLLEPWPFVFVDFMTGVDMETGRALYDIRRWSFTDAADRRRYTDYDMPGAAARADYVGTEIDWCPGIAARNWHNDAWNPDLGFHYVATTMNCGTQVVVEGAYVAGEGYTLRRGAGAYPGGGARDPDRNSATYGEPVDWDGELLAIDPVTSQRIWAVRWAPNNQTPVMATAGGLVFQGGSNEGEMRAFDAATGQELWAFRVGSQFAQSPISFVGEDGRQYIAIIASSANTGQINFNDPINDADRYRRAGTTLYAFALPPSVAATAVETPTR